MINPDDIKAGMVLGQADAQILRDAIARLNKMELRTINAPDGWKLVPVDTKRMDWLCAHCVEVRDPQMYGSHAMFHAQQDSEEWDLPFHTTLREQIDEAMRNIEEKSK